MRQMNVMLCHPVGDVAEVTADMGQGRPVAQQVRRQGVPGLVRHPAADVEVSDPGLEAAVEPLVGERLGAVGVARLAGEQGDHRLLGGVRPPAVAGGEPVRRLGLPGGEKIIEPVGDPDRGVEVADLGLVMPEHRQSSVAADAVPAELPDLADAAAGNHDGLPDVTQSLVLGIVFLREAGKVALVGQGLGDLVGERAARPHRRPAGDGHLDDELAVQPEFLGPAGFHGPAQDLADGVEHDAAGVAGDRGRLAV
jgi:hypothetical protein